MGPTGPEQRIGSGRPEPFVEGRAHVRGVQDVIGRDGRVRVRGRVDGRRRGLQMGQHERATDVINDRLYENRNERTISVRWAIALTATVKNALDRRPRPRRWT